MGRRPKLESIQGTEQDLLEDLGDSNAEGERDPEEGEDEEL